MWPLKRLLSFEVFHMDEFFNNTHDFIYFSTDVDFSTVVSNSPTEKREKEIILQYLEF